jgi:hypothetical protein
MRTMWNAQRIVDSETDGKLLLLRPRRIEECNIKMGLRE